MSDQIKHECGIALIRLLKPLEYYQIKYGNWRYGLNKLYLLMEKQHNRGQDGAGLVSVKLNTKPGKNYIDRFRSNETSPIKKVFDNVFEGFQKHTPERLNDPNFAKNNIPFASELYLGHLRYGTFGKNNIETVHPVMRQNNWKSRNLVLAGNFNLTNVEELFEKLIDLGQHPVEYSDTITILEKVGHFLDEENQRLFDKAKKQGLSKVETSEWIAQNIDVSGILSEASKNWDGGYAIAGIIGHGDAFVMRDPNGIRPAFYYHDDEIAVVASERPVIQTVMNINVEDINELARGEAIIIKRNGEIAIEEIQKKKENKACSFERIYFSRGSDKDIYKERIKLGQFLTPQILEAVDYDLDNTVFSFIPNTAENAFYGMVKGIENYMLEQSKMELLKNKEKLSEELIDKIIFKRPRVEKIAIKDVKLRTFISQDVGRKDLVGHVYDVTYGNIETDVDKLVIIDDSIVRGTTLRESILSILDRLSPKMIVVVSSAPQIRYPDCYGIDMAILGDFVAFEAAIQLLKETKQDSIITDVYNKSVAQKDLPKEKIVNYVKNIYKPFSPEQISEKISQILKPEGINSEVKIVYQSIENLHRAIPNHTGDWYFTGNYPTPGGNKVVNKAFINYIEDNHSRGY